VLAIEGLDDEELTREQIAHALSRSGQFVDQWVVPISTTWIGWLDPTQS